MKIPNQKSFFCFVIDGKLHATVLNMTQARVRNITNVTTCRGSETAKIWETVFTPPPTYILSLYMYYVRRYVGWGCMLNCLMLSSLLCFPAFFAVPISLYFVWTFSSCQIILYRWNGTEGNYRKAGRWCITSRNSSSTRVSTWNHSWSWREHTKVWHPPLEFMNYVVSICMCMNLCIPIALYIYYVQE